RWKPDSLSRLAEHIEQYRAEESARWESEPQFCADYVVQMQDTCDCLLRLTAVCKSLEDMRSRIESMFRDIEETANATNVVLLSTIHRAKGLERDVVYLIESRLLPHPRATAAWELEQERNMAYVAVTRAKRELVLVGEVSKLFVPQQR